MTHQRQLIREAIKAKLVNQTDAGDRVHLNRVVPLFDTTWHTELPAILIYTRTESATVDLSAPMRYQRVTSVVVDLLASLTDGQGVDNDLDDMADIVERLLLQDETLGGLVSSLVLSTSAMELRGDGQMTVAAISIEFNATWYQYEPREDFNDSLDDLATVHNDYSLGGDQAPDDRTQDTITLPVV